MGIRQRWRAEADCKTVTYVEKVRIFQFPQNSIVAQRLGRSVVSREIASSNLVGTANALLA